jgi:hypothetical protein
MKKLTHIFFTGALILLPIIAAAQSGLPAPSGSGSGIPPASGSGSGIPPPSGSGTGTPCPGSSLSGICNPLRAETVCEALKIFLNALITLAMPVAVLFLVYAGFRFVWARGNPSALKDARRNLFYVVIGIGIFLGAWVLGQIIANTVGALGGAAGQSVSSIGQCK